jgi:hypothetical protein
MAQCPKTTKDGKVRCQGSEGHPSLCFLGGVTLADFDHAADAADAHRRLREGVQTVLDLVEARLSESSCTDPATRHDLREVARLCEIVVPGLVHSDPRPE